jgi:predicted nucleotidyltransferase
MDFERPVEAVIPGAIGRLLAALARVDTELPISTLASVAGVGRTRASGLVSQLHQLGLVDRRDIGRITMVSLARDSAAGDLIDRLAHLRTVVIDQLRDLAAKIKPAPLVLAVYGSFARGEAGAECDIDVLAVRAPDGDSEQWAASLTTFATRARRLTGNPVQILDYDLRELRRKAGSRATLGKDFWDALRRDCIVLAGASVDSILAGDHVASR